MTETAPQIKITSPTLHVTIWFIIFVFIVIVVMACFFKVEVVARGQGKVVPLSRVQIVQPEFDGKITAIHIRNGSTVHQGDILVELDTTDAEAELNTITAEIVRLQIERARITALVSSIDIGNIQTESFSRETLRAFAESANAKHDFYAEQARLLVAEVEDLQAMLSQNTARITINERSISVTQANIDRIEAAIAIQAERLKIAQELLGQGISSRSAFLDVEEAFTALEKERQVYLRELNQKRSQETGLRAERRSIISAQRSLLLQRKSDIEARLKTLQEQSRIAERRIIGAQLTAPMDGVVDQLKVFTIGAVAKGSEQVLSIVPEDQDVEIEALFNNYDIGFVEVGQIANINLDAYPSERFGFLVGVVSDIAADSTEVAGGAWAYQVRVTPETGELKNGPAQFALRPGMTAVVDITTGKRRLISYFFAPIVDIIQSALGER
ncbi:MAG: HlyD family type I secretion periplasmic adaptor subunit [Gemmatimonadetes bacterium]|nr:HlyD family type I secretion periplasmic adaptor subunit [Gemmatimonadota bacterium]